jgi:hypothetical protein
MTASASDREDRLVLGPLLRYVDETSAAVWVETDGPATVTVTRGAATASAGTFVVHDHHYALVELDGLEPGTTEAYTVAVDDDLVWPPSGTPFPDPVIATLEAGRPLHLSFGSCRTSVSHDEKGNKTHGVDALRAWALRVAGLVDAADPTDADLDQDRLPDLVLFLGDQVYADETTDAMREFIGSRRDIEQAPWTELKDFEEYAHLYKLAWSDPANRWLLSTVPSAMIFDDHDIRDDWNTSLDWRREMEATSWWHGRIVAGLASYWVYQHLGNLSPSARETDRSWTRSRTASTSSRRRTAGATRATSTRRRASWSSTRARPASSTRTTGRCSTTTRRPGSTGSCAATSTTCWSARHCRSCSRAGCTTSRRSARRSHKGRSASAVAGWGRGCASWWTSSTGARSRPASRRSPGR